MQVGLADEDAEACTCVQISGIIVMTSTNLAIWDVTYHMRLVLHR